MDMDIKMMPDNRRKGGDAFRHHNIKTETQSFVPDLTAFSAQPSALLMPAGVATSAIDYGAAPSRQRIWTLRVSLWQWIVLAIVLCLAVIMILAKTTITNLMVSGYTAAYSRIEIATHPLVPISQDQRQVINLAQAQALVDKIVNQPVRISVAGSIVRPSKQLVRSWIGVSAENYGVERLSINQTGLNDYINGMVSKLTQKPVPQITVNLSNGTQSTLQAGRNGLTFPDTQKLIGSISSQLLNGNGVNAQLPGITTPFTTINHPTDNKLIEVNTTTKMLYAYEDGVLIKSFPVSAGAPATPTPTGTFHIWIKLPVQDMYAYLPNGRLEYNQPNVQWINYFDHNGDAIHAVYWRPLSYFGHVNASHGCVGLITNDALWIYNWAPIGTTVIVHR